MRIVFFGTPDFAVPSPGGAAGLAPPGRGSRHAARPPARTRAARVGLTREGAGRGGRHSHPATDETERPRTARRPRSLAPGTRCRRGVRAHPAAGPARPSAARHDQRPRLAVAATSRRLAGDARDSRWRYAHRDHDHAGRPGTRRRADAGDPRDGDRARRDRRARSRHDSRHLVPGCSWRSSMPLDRGNVVETPQDEAARHLRAADRQARWPDRVGSARTTRSTTGCGHSCRGPTPSRSTTARASCCMRRDPYASIDRRASDRSQPGRRWARGRGSRRRAARAAKGCAPRRGRRGHGARDSPTAGRRPPRAHRPRVPRRPPARSWHALHDGAIVMAAARAAALRVLQRVSGGATLADALVRERDGLADARDRALTSEIATGTLRWRAALDAAIASASGRPVAQIDPAVLDILRLSAYQLRHLDRTPRDAVVHDAVELTRREGHAAAAGFVNAVLRRLARPRVRRPRPGTGLEDGRATLAHAPRDRAAPIPRGWSRAGSIDSASRPTADGRPSTTSRPRSRCESTD